MGLAGLHPRPQQLKCKCGAPQRVLAVACAVLSCACVMAAAHSEGWMSDDPELDPFSAWPVRLAASTHQHRQQWQRQHEKEAERRMQLATASSNASSACNCSTVGVRSSTPSMRQYTHGGNAAHAQATWQTLWITLKQAHPLVASRPPAYRARP